MVGIGPVALVALGVAQESRGVGIEGDIRVRGQGRQNGKGRSEGSAQEHGDQVS